MKILFAIDAYFTNNHGTSISAQRFADELRKRGHEVRILTACDEPRENIFSMPALKIPFFREHYENYKDRKGIARKTLIKSLVYLWVTMIISMILVKRLWLVLRLAFIAICVSIHLVHMSHARTEDDTQEKKEEGRTSCAKTD